MARVTVLRVLAVSSMAVSIPLMAAKQDVPTGIVQVKALGICRRIAEVAERVSCYDRATDSLIAATSNRQIVIIDRSEIKAARRGLFGFSLPKIPLLDNTSSKEEAAEAKTLTARITGVSSSGYGKYRFRIEGGATWETVEASSDLDGLRAGETITLERGMLGGYFLKSGRARVRARRLPESS